MKKEFISVFDMFKIGVGPSSSHTLGPWRAATSFLKLISEKESLDFIESVQVRLYGSLAKTGKGHGTDLAVMMGLCGEDPVTCDTASLGKKVEEITNTKKIKLFGNYLISFDPAVHLEFLKKESLPFHPNGMKW